MLSETRERFVKAILQQVPLERIAEVHFFPPIKQGGVESGVAVVAARPEEQDTGEEPTPESAESADVATEAEHCPVPPDFDEELEPAEPASTDERAVLETDASTEDEESEPPAPRYTVYTARYRLVLKGPDRGKWDSAVVAEADAPLVTVDAVVRGVQRRSGEADEPERLSGEELRAAVEAAAPRQAEERA